MYINGLPYTYICCQRYCVCTSTCRLFATIWLMCKSYHHKSCIKYTLIFMWILCKTFHANFCIRIATSSKSSQFTLVVFSQLFAYHDLLLSTLCYPSTCMSNVVYYIEYAYPLQLWLLWWCVGTTGWTIPSLCYSNHCINLLLHVFSFVTTLYT